MLKIVFLFLMAGGLPVAIAMAGSSLLYLVWTQTTPPFVVIHRMVSGIDSFPLLAVPFFILAGNLMNNAGITNRIYNFALALVGWLRGGLGHVNVVGSVIFAGMSGTAIADAAGLGTIEIKAMTDHGYSPEFSVGVTAASATLGPIIPPSLPFVIYAMMANVSVGALFLSGILPGVLMAVLMMATVTFFAHKNGWGGDIKFSGSRFGKALLELAIVIVWPLAIWGAVQIGAPAQFTVFVALVVLFAADRAFRFQAVLPIMTPVILIGGMTTGIFTLSVRYHSRPSASAHTQAAMAPSVGVKMPVVMPPMSLTGVMIGSTAWKRKMRSSAKIRTMAPKTTDCAGRPSLATRAQVTSGQAITMASSSIAAPKRLPENFTSPPQPFLCAK